MILGGEDAVRRPGFLETLLFFIRRGVATFIAIPGPVGYFAARVFLNDALYASAANNDRDAALATLLRMLVSSKQHRFERATLKHARSG